MWNCRLTQQWKKDRLYDVRQTLTKQNVSISTHEGLSFNSFCWLTDYKHVLQRQVMTENTGVLLKWEGTWKNLPLLFAIFASSGEWSVCQKHKHTHQKPAVIVQQQQHIQSMPWQSWEQTQNGDGMISASSPPYKTCICTLANFNWFH